MEGAYLNIMKAIYEKLTANITLNRKKLSPEDQEQNKGVLEVLATVFRQQKEIKRGSETAIIRRVMACE